MVHVLCHLTVFMLNETTISPQYILASVGFPKAQFLALDSSSEFHSNFTHFQNPLRHISFWTANTLTLNSSKTEFLFIGLKKQVPKIHDSLVLSHYNPLSLEPQLYF